MSKDFLLLKKEPKPILVTLLVLGFVALNNYDSDIDPLPLCLGICISGMMLSLQTIERRLIDREYNHLANFRLMGLTDTAYLLSAFLLDIAVYFSIQFIFLAFCRLRVASGFSPFSSAYHFTCFIGAALLFDSSLILMSYAFSNVITNPRVAKRVSRMLIALIFIAPVMAALKASIGFTSDQPPSESSFLSNFGLEKSKPEYQNIIDLLMKPFPFTPMLSYYRTNYMAYKPENGFQGLNLTPLLWYVGQSIFYLVIYLLTNPMTKGAILGLFKSSKRDGYTHFSDRVSMATLTNQGETAVGGSGEILSISNVWKRFGSFEALKDVSCQIFGNRITCILGHNGAGKTTLINAICGVNPPTSGKIFVDGLDVYSNKKAFSGKIGYCTAQDTLYGNMTVSEYLVFIALMKGIADYNHHLSQIIIQCNLTEFSGQLIKNLSGGTKRRTTIASALIGSPKILIMDEPSSGVDPQNRRQLWGIIGALKSPDRAVILTTHHLEEAEYLSEEVIILDKGKVDVIGSPADILEKYGIGYRVRAEGFDKDFEIKAFSEEIFKAFDENEEFEYEEKNGVLIGGKRDALGSTLREGGCIKIDKTKYEKLGIVEITVPIKYKDLLGGALKAIKKRKGKLILECNSLEEAFFELGEKNQNNMSGNNIRGEGTANEGSTPTREPIENEWLRRFQKEYTPSTKNLIKALMYRRYAVFFSSEVQILSFIYIVLVPPLILWTFIPGIFSIGAVYILPLIIAFIYTLICSFYAELPFEERKFKIRYTLKMMGCNSTVYYLSLFLADFVFSVGMILLSWLILFGLYREDMSFTGVFLKWEFFEIFLNTLFWSLSFISQSKQSRIYSTNQQFITIFSCV